MGSTKWTKEQQEVIDHRDGNLLVSAAAGSGKTAVLVERIISMILDIEEKVDIDKLLVVTFTNAAASEMRERIADAVSKALEEATKLEKKDVIEHLQKQILFLNKANITTIHSFCLDVIKNNIHLITLDPNFRIGDTTECQLIAQEAIDEVFEELYEQGYLGDENSEKGKRFLKLIDSFAERNGDNQVQSLIMSIYNFAMSFPNPEKWLNESADAFLVNDDFDFTSSKWGRIVINSVKTEIEDIVGNMEKALATVHPYLGQIENIQKIITESERIDVVYDSLDKGWDDFIKAIGEFYPEDYRKGKKIKKDDPDEMREAWKIATEYRKEAIESMKKVAEMYKNRYSKDIKKEIDMSYPIVRAISDAVLEFWKKFEEAKRDKGIIDFNDIEHFALEILVDEDENGCQIPSETAKRYSEEFKEIFVDEYQDSNLVQEAILSSIANKEMPNRFMVGDVKQSIYRFRQAKPEIFLHKYETYSTEKDKDGRKIMLYKNFRSRKNVLDAVNFIFENIMSKELGEIEYNDDEKLNPGAVFEECYEENAIVGGSCDVHIIEKKVNENLTDEQLEEEEDLDNIQIEARAIGKIIKEIVGKNSDGKIQMVYDKEEKRYRQAKYKDIVILLRATSNWASVLTEEFTNMDIPVYADTGTGYFDTIEIKTIVSLLKVIDNPMQDIPLLAVLKSPIYNFTPEELIDIRIVNRNVSFYEAMKIYASFDDCDNKKVRDFLERLEDYQERSSYLSTDELLWYLYNETGYYAYAAILPAGKQRQANLRILFERAKQFEDTSFKGIFNFINFVEKLKKADSDMGEAKTLSENADVVRIMSIHKSKGLEFPIVICGGMGKRFNKMDMNRGILYHHELGYGPQVVNLETRLSYPSMMKEAMKKQMVVEMLSEEMRVLYVAFTRAKEKLIITGAVNDVEKNLQKWASNSQKVTKDNKLDRYNLLKSASFLDWIMSVAIAHKDARGILPLDSEIVEKNDESEWKFKIHKREDYTLANGEEEEINLADVLKDELTSDRAVDYSEIVRNRLDFKYPYQKSVEKSGSISVTEIKRLWNLERGEEDRIALEEEKNAFIENIDDIEIDSNEKELNRSNKKTEIKRPKFIQENKDEKLSPTHKGSVVHLVMQIINMDRVNTIDEIKNQIEEFVQKEIITQKEADVVNPFKIYKFFKSDLGTRMKNADFIGREKAFYTEINMKDLFEKEEIDYDESIMLRGIIDAYFEENEEIVLLDYKTDFVNEENREEVINRYRKQLEIYAKVIEEITDKKVKEQYIYLFGVDESVRIDM
ncbi:helicase-exonuclease AddAB subunit AddA [Peptacetobacter sp.]|uniref:helicase-exonuclease AddAB subunit AddA n=1 Tax=Peptacetobacter sp. TaxID=2991975 RepID=UPI002E795C86|nr:helicase-exonuclease AddAB subunit AddA [Peptacetobacter sp.]MEE0450615.1 helicase-exonuclease AddAB subunit AddA [Peptacetobacter sp.]